MVEIKFRSRVRRAVLTIVTVAAFSFASLPSLAMGSKPAKDAAPDTKQQAVSGAARTLVWHDGSQERTLWRDDGLVAEFGHLASARSAVKAVVPTAKERTTKHGGLRMWEVTEDAVTTLNTIKRANPHARVSPVFRDSETGGRLRALPGNVIVHLDPSWDDARVGDWAKAQGVEIVRKLTFGNNIYLIKTDAGLVALEMATKLSATAGVVRAVPDWWEEVTAR